MNSKILMTALLPLAMAASTYSYGAEDSAGNAVKSPGHTSDMPGREGHSSEHMKKKHQHMDPKTVKSTEHGSEMQGREGHTGPGTDPVKEGGMTTDMPGREGHSSDHKKK